MISCPFHSDEKPSFGIREDGVWNCFSCNESGGWKELSTLLGFETKKLSFEEKVKEKFRHAESKLEKIKSKELPYDFIEYDDNPPANVLERISSNLVKKYGIGEATFTFPRYFIIPIRVNGYNSYVCRYRIRKPAKHIRRWRLAKEFSKVLFPEPKEETIIVEGVLDAFAIEDFGFSASSCFGHSLSELQISQLLEADVKRIVLLFDSYEEHYSKSLKNTFKILAQFFNVSVMRLGKDADEVSREEFIESYEKRICLSNEMDRMLNNEFREKIMKGLNGF